MKTMSNCSSYFPMIFFLLALITRVTHAQSPELLEQTLIGSPRALELSRAELERCQKKTDCSSAAGLSMLNGVLLLSQGEAQSALTRFDALPAPEGLEAFHLFYVAQAQFYSHQYEDAFLSFQKAATKFPPPWLLTKIKRRLPEALLQAGRAREALPLLEELLRERATPETLESVVHAQELLGRKRQAQRTAQRFLVDYPTHPASSWLLARYVPVFSEQERYSRAKKWMDADQPLEAISELSPSLAGQLRKNRAAMDFLFLEALSRAERTTEAESFAQLLLKAAPEWASRVQMLLAREALRRDEPARAQTLLTELEQQHPQSTEAPEARFLQGWISLHQNDFNECVRLFSTFPGLYPSSSRREEAIWYLGLCHLRANQMDSAQAAFKNLIALYPSSPLVPQARYWHVRSAELAKDAPSKGFGEQYEELRRELFGSIYAVYSDLRLHSSGNKPPKRGAPPPTPTPAVPERLSLFALLSSVGLSQDAATEASHQLRSLDAPENALGAGAVLLERGAFAAAHQLATQRLWRSAVVERQPEALALLYPQAYRPTVDTFSRQHAIPAPFVWAIMKRESRFRPDVKSSVGARGLMQLIPKTAERVSENLKLPAAPAEALFEPALNIRLGTWYLGALRRRFPHRALVAAAYNAGPAPVLSWVEKYGHLPLDLFVELIPFKETRGYVKQVLADEFVYRHLYDLEPQREDGTPLTVPTPLRDGVDF